MAGVTEDVIRNLTAIASVPLVFRQYISNWNVSQWSEEKWCSIFGNKEIPFRCLKKDFISDEPCWERRCAMKTMTFKDFLRKLNGEEWMYFDYKYLHQWLPSDNELCKVNIII